MVVNVVLITITIEILAWKQFINRKINQNSAYLLALAHDHDIVPVAIVVGGVSWLDGNGAGAGAQVDTVVYRSISECQLHEVPTPMTSSQYKSKW